MKIDLTEQATTALKELMSRFKSRNEYIVKRFSPLVSELVIFTASSLTEANIDDITKRLIPDEKRGKAFFKRLEKLYADADVEQLSQLEKSLEKMRTRKNKITDGSAKKA